MEKTRPAIVDGLSDVVDISAGGMHNLCLTATGKVYSFGCNDEGALGRDTSEEGSEFVPKPIDLPGSCVKISAGDSHSACLLEDGRVFAWGSFRVSWPQPYELAVSLVKLVPLIQRSFVGYPNFLPIIRFPALSSVPYACLTCPSERQLVGVLNWASNKAREGCKDKRQMVLSEDAKRRKRTRKGKERPFFLLLAYCPGFQIILHSYCPPVPLSPFFSSFAYCFPFALRCTVRRSHDGVLGGNQQNHLNSPLVLVVNFGNSLPMPRRWNQLKNMPFLWNCPR